MLSAMASDMNQDFLLNDTRISIDISTINNLENSIIRLRETGTIDFEQSRILLRKVATLYEQPALELLRPYQTYLKTAAERLGKPVSELIIDCDAGLQLNRKKYREFLKRLVDLLDNSLVHGIESAEERRLAGKSGSGRIAISVSSGKEFVVFTVSDDGRGIDRQKVFSRAIEKGVAKAEINYSDQEILDFIFTNGISTLGGNEAGTGAGLSGLLEETENLGGTIIINTEPGAGTEFIFRFPNDADLVQLQDSDYLKGLLSSVFSSANRFLNRSDNIKAPVVRIKETLTLENYSSMIYLDGIEKGLFIMTADSQGAQQLYKKICAFSGISVSEAGVLSLSEDDLDESVSECLNTILGNAMGEITDYLSAQNLISTGEDFIDIEPPVSLSSTKRGRIKYLGAQIYCSDLSSDNAGRISLYYIRNKTNKM